MTPTTCPQCNSPLQEKSGISTKTQKPYKFTGCTGYPNCTFIYREPKLPTPSNNEEVMEALRKLYERVIKVETTLLEALKDIPR